MYLRIIETLILRVWKKWYGVASLLFGANCNMQMCDLRNICKHLLLDIKYASEANIPFAWSVFYFCFLCRLPDICYKEGDIWNQSQYLLLASWRVRSFLLIGIMTYTPERLDGKEMKVLNLGRLYHWQPFFLCAQNILKISRVSSGKPISSRIHSICRALPVQYFPKKLENILQIHFNLSHNSLRNLAQADL